jgi:class 3 adenylate cyclase
VTRAIQRYEGHIASTKGDGLLAVFGHPVAHENDVHRTVRAGLDITREVRRRSASLPVQRPARWPLGIPNRRRAWGQFAPSRRGHFELTLRVGFGGGDLP